MATQSDAQQIAVMASQIKEIHHRLFGNGRPGIIENIQDDMSKLEHGHSEWLKSHDIRIERAERGHWKVAVIVGVAVGLFNFLTGPVFASVIKIAK